MSEAAAGDAGEAGGPAVEAVEDVRAIDDGGGAVLALLEEQAKEVAAHDEIEVCGGS